jgi:hypothetical protein
VASAVEMLSGKRKKDYAAESAAQAFEAQVNAMGYVPQNEAETMDSGAAAADEIESEEEEEEELVAA